MAGLGGPVHVANPQGNPVNTQIVGSSGNIADVNSDGQLHAVLRGKVDSGNSTTTNLVASAVFTGTAIDTLDFATVTTLVHSDQNGTLDVQYSADGSTDWHGGESYTILAGATKFFTPTIQSRYMRIVYTNGTIDTTDFHIETVLRKQPIKWSSHNIDESITDQDDSQLVKAVNTGKDPDGTYRNVNVTRDGDMSISDNSSGLAISEGLVTKKTFVHKFGVARDFDISDGYVTVWDGAEDNVAWENMVYDYSTTADIDSISSSNNADTGIEIFIQGLNSLGVLISECAILNGQTRVPLSNSYKRVFRAYNTNGTAFAGHVIVYPNTSLTAGVPTDKSKIRIVIDPNFQQTEMAVYTIPANKRGYMRSWFASTAGAKRASSHTIRLLAKKFGGVFLTKHTSNIDVSGTSYINHKYDEPTAYSANTDLEIRMNTDQDIAGVSAGFDIVLTDITEQWQIDQFIDTRISFDVSSQEGSPNGVAFSDDGTKMFVIGTANDDVFEYDLTETWNTATAVYNSNFLNSSLQLSSPRDLCFSNSGTRLYCTDSTNNAVYQYNLTSGFDITTASYASKSLDVSSQGTNPRGAFMNSAGTSLFVIDASANALFTYTLSTPWELDSATYTRTLSLDSQSWEAVTFKPDGLKLYVANDSDNCIKSYTLTTAFDTDTAIADDLELDVSDTYSNLAGMWIRSDGLMLATVDNGTDTVYQYHIE
jgi:hypothetical protein